MLFQGCSKEAASPLTAGERYDPTPQILQFLQNVQTKHQAHAKTGEGFSADSAVWYIEASLNYTVGNIGLDYSMSMVDSVTVPLVIGESTTQAAAVYAAFETLVAALAPMTTDEQHIVVVDVVEPTAGASELLTIVTIGSGYAKSAPNTTYGIKDYRYFSGGSSAPSTICDCQPLPQVPQPVYCANIIIQNRINTANQIDVSNGQYTTDVETWQTATVTYLAGRTLSNYDPVLLQAPFGDGYHDTRTYSWINSASQGGTCLTPSEMSYWTGNATTGTWSAILTIKSTYCPTKTFLNCAISGDTHLSSDFFPAPPPPTTGQAYVHRCSFRYGIIVSPGH